jgi:hypothetical protein
MDYASTRCQTNERDGDSSKASIEIAKASGGGAWGATHRAVQQWLFSTKPNGTNRKSGHFIRQSKKQGIRKEENSKGYVESRSRHSNGWEGTNKFVDGLVRNRTMNEKVGKQKITRA